VERYRSQACLLVMRLVLVGGLGFANLFLFFPKALFAGRL
jgi:hypothetical protein